MRIDIYHHIVCPESTAKLDAILTIVTNLQRSIIPMTAALDRIRQEVAESRAVTQSAITMISGLAAQILELKDDPVALEALAADLDAQQQALAAAITANTPAAPGGGDTTSGGGGTDTTSGGGGTDTVGGGAEEGGGGPTETTEGATPEG